MLKVVNPIVLVSLLFKVKMLMEVKDHKIIVYIKISLNRTIE